MMDVKDFVANDYFKGVFTTSPKNKNSNITEQAFTLIKHKGLANHLNEHILSCDKQASELKDRIVLLLITMDCLKSDDQDGIFFKQQLGELSLKIKEYIVDDLSFVETKLVTKQQFKPLLEKEKKENFKVESSDSLTESGQLKSSAQSLSETIRPITKKMREIFNNYDSKEALTREEIERMQKLNMTLSTSDRDNDIAIITTSNFKCQFLEKALEKLVNRLQGYESFVSIFSTYELPQLFDLLKNGIESKKDWKIEEYQIDKLDEKTKEMVNASRESIKELTTETLKLLKQIEEGKEELSITNNCLDTMIQPRAKDSLKEYQLSMNNLTESKFNYHYGRFEQIISNVSTLFLKLDLSLNKLKETLNHLEELKKQNPTEELIQKAKKLSISSDLLKEQQACYEKQRKWCATEIVYLNRLIEVVKYRLEGVCIPTKFTSYVSAKTNNGSFKGQLEQMGKRIYFLTEKPTTMIGERQLSSLKDTMERYSFLEENKPSKIISTQSEPPLSKTDPEPKVENNITINDSISDTYKTLSPEKELELKQHRQKVEQELKELEKETLKNRENLEKEIIEIKNERENLEKKVDEIKKEIVNLENKIETPESENKTNIPVKELNKLQSKIFANTN